MLDAGVKLGCGLGNSPVVGPKKIIFRRDGKGQLLTYRDKKMQEAPVPASRNHHANGLQRSNQGMLPKVQPGEPVMTVAEADLDAVLRLTFRFRPEAVA